MRHRFVLFAAMSAALISGAADAATPDPLGDFVGSYTGALNGELDILGVSAAVEGANLRLTATVNGVPGASPGSLYVFGIDRGSGIQRLGIPVAFDALAVLFPDGLGRAVTFPTIGAPTITPVSGAVSINGSTISGLFPLALLPPNGLPVQNYTFTAWSRLRVNPAADGLIGEIADYAPNAGGFSASVPEPGAWATLIIGFGALGALMRGRVRKGAPSEG
jgi:hypothetical protein